MAKKIEKLLKRAQEHLDPNEQVLAAVDGTYETKRLGNDTVRSGVMMATPKRVIFYAKKLGGYDLESFEYSKISSFEQSKGMMGGKVSFFASGNEVSMKWISDKDAMQSFVAAVKENLHGAPSSAASTSSADSDVMEQIRKLGELHKSGILSDDEFEAKKAELLSRL